MTSPAGRPRVRVALASAIAVCLGAWAAAATVAGTAGTAVASTREDTVTALSDLSGTATVLRWDTATLAAWKHAGVTMGPAGTATDVSGGMELPITSGYLESHSDHSFKPGYLLGSIDHLGSGVSFASTSGSTSTSTSVEATDLVFDLGQSMVYATIGGTEDFPLFSLQQDRREVKRVGRTLEIERELLYLTPTGAAELDAIFHTSVIASNTEVAAVGITARGRPSRYSYTGETVEFPRLSGIALSLRFAAGALAAFRSDGITPGAAGSASYDSGSGEVSLPITGGTAVVHPGPDGRPGRIAGVVLDWGSGLVLGGGSTSLSFSNLTFVPSTSTVYASVNGGADDGALFSVKRARKSSIRLTGGNLEMRGALLDLTADGAETLNTAFHTTGFERGFELGRLTVVASG